ncbi:hypothetical protein BJX70DRAFT_357494 [Aspergillus crustosus]
MHPKVGKPWEARPVMTIAARAVECARHLEEVAQSATAGDVKQEWENQIFRFNLWCENNFVFAPTRASMDWRLRNAVALEASVCELLDDLQSALVRYAAVVKTGRVSQQAGQRDAFSEVLKDLFRLSRAIRRSGVLRRFVKLGAYIEYDEDGLNLTKAFRDGAERIVEFRLKHSQASETLQQRVVDTVCLRQQHFAYLSAKWEKGKAELRKTIKAPVMPRSTLGATLSVTGTVTSNTTKQGKKRPAAVPLHLRSLMTATTAQPNLVKRVHSLKSTASMENVELEWKQTDLPPPPKLPPGAMEYECPFCYMVCSAGEFLGDRWKKHVVQDIIPFFCVLDDCPTPHALFESGRDWLKHMRNQHVLSGWTCMDDSHEATAIFDTESAFKHHMHACHQQSFDKEDLGDITAACYQRLPVEHVLTSCSFCPPESQIDIPADGMASHVAEHLLALAQISVPWQADGDGSDESQLSRADSLSGAQSHIALSRDDLDEVLFASSPEDDRDSTFALAEEDNLANEEYQPQDQSDWTDVSDAIFDDLWRTVRQELQLPPLDHRPPDSLPGLRVKVAEREPTPSQPA